MPIPINISGSRSAAILGLSQYQTPLSVWLEIMEMQEPGFCNKNNYVREIFEGNTATRFGNAFEDAILRATERHFNYVIINEQALYKKGFLSCHIDGELDGALIEAKTTAEFSFRSSWGEEGTDLIPQIYQCQVQHNMMVAGLEKCIVPVLIFPKRQNDYEELGIGVDDDFSMIKIHEWVKVLAEMGNLKFFHIDADKEFQELMMEKYTTWWNKFVLKKKPPEPMSMDDIKAMIPEPVGSIIVPSHVLALIKKQKDIGQEIGDTGDLAKHRTKLKVEILKACQGLDKTLDDDSKDKWILMDEAGKKVGSYGRNKKGTLIFR